jgi:hypothetical protein
MVSGDRLILPTLGAFGVAGYATLMTHQLVSAAVGGIQGFLLLWLFLVFTAIARPYAILRWGRTIIGGSPRYTFGLSMMTQQFFFLPCGALLAFVLDPDDVVTDSLLKGFGWIFIAYFLKDAAEPMDANFWAHHVVCTAGTYYVMCVCVGVRRPFIASCLALEIGSWVSNWYTLGAPTVQRSRFYVAVMAVSNLAGLHTARSVMKGVENDAGRATLWIVSVLLTVLRQRASVQAWRASQSGKTA